MARRRRRQLGAACARSSTPVRAGVGAVLGLGLGSLLGYGLAKADSVMHPERILSPFWLAMPILGTVGAVSGAAVGARKPQC